MHCEFVEWSKRYEDVIVPREGHNSIAIEVIVAKIQRRLQRFVAASAGNQPFLTEEPFPRPSLIEEGQSPSAIEMPNTPLRGQADSRE